MKYVGSALSILFLCSMPAAVHAAISIQEVAWMGSVENANAEWIELYNDGPSCDLTGWSLNAADGQPAIPLSGVIAERSYVVLERTSDESAPTVSAHQIYTGAMGNTGEVLELRDASGAVVDRVDGMSDWAIGGDNTAKLSLQRTATGWVTAVPTPGQNNASSDDASYLEDKATSATAISDEGSDTNTTVPKSTVTATTKKEKEVHLPPPPTPLISIALGNDVTVAAGVPLRLSADVRKEGGKPLELNTLVWNFGDGSTGDGQTVTHTYLFAGDYVVSVRGTRTHFDPPLIDTDQLIVHVVPLLLHVSHADKDSIEVTNMSGHDVDLSRFALTAGKKHFRIPQGTILLTGAHIRFAAGITKLRVLNPRSVGIFTPGNVLASTYAAGHAEPVSEIVPVLEEDSFAQPPESNDVQMEAEFTVEPTEEVAVNDEKASGTPPIALASVAHADTGEPTSAESVPLFWWLAALGALVATTATVAVLVRRERAEIIEGFVVESDE